MRPTLDKPHVRFLKLSPAIHAAHRPSHSFSSRCVISRIRATAMATDWSPRRPPPAANTSSTQAQAAPAVGSSDGVPSLAAGTVGLITNLHGRRRRAPNRRRRPGCQKLDADHPGATRSRHSRNSSASATGILTPPARHPSSGSIAESNPGIPPSSSGSSITTRMTAWRRGRFSTGSGRFDHSGVCLLCADAERSVPDMAPMGCVRHDARV